MKTDTQRLHTTDMIMLGWARGKTKKDHTKESTGDHVPFREGVGLSIDCIPTLDESSSKSANRLDWSRLSKSAIDS